MTNRRNPASTGGATTSPAPDVATESGGGHHSVEAMHARVRDSGRRGAPAWTLGEALADYWRWVAVARREQRDDVLGRLRADVASGRATPRACAVIALGEPDFELARAAARAYVGTWPAVLERREQAVSDVVDWIVRSLALSRAALCCALIDTADAASLERLAPLRGRLAAAEAAEIFAACAQDARSAVREFVGEWRELLTSPGGQPALEAVAVATGFTLRNQCDTSRGSRFRSQSNTSACQATRCT
jgi:hypothetical protein